MHIHIINITINGYLCPSIDATLKHLGYAQFVYGVYPKLAWEQPWMLWDTCNLCMAQIPYHQAFINIVFEVVLRDAHAHKLTQHQRIWDMHNLCMARINEIASMWFYVCQLEHVGGCSRGKLGLCKRSHFVDFLWIGKGLGCLL